MTKIQKFVLTGCCGLTCASAAQAASVSGGAAHGLAVRTLLAIIDVPEPGVLVLTGGAMLALVGFARIRSRKR